MPQNAASASKSKKIVLLLTSTMTVMAGATIAPALPRMRDAFVQHEQVEILVPLSLTVTALFIALFASLSGVIADRFGRKRLLLVSLVLYAIAGSSGLYLTSLETIIVGRMLLGIAVAGTMTATVTLIADYFHGAERERFMGFQSAFMAIGGATFLTGGGLLADLHWRAPFSIYLFALLVAPMAFAFIKEPDRATQYTGETDSTKQSRRVFYYYGLAFCAMVIFYLVPVELPFYMKSLGYESSGIAGMAIAFSTIFSSIGALVFPRLRLRMSRGAIFTILHLFIAAGFITLAFSRGFVEVAIAMSLFGFGFGLFFPNINVTVADLASPRLRGRVMGGLTAAVFFGQFLSPLIATPVERTVGLGGAGGLFYLTGIVAFIFSLGFFYAGRARFAGRTEAT